MAQTLPPMPSTDWLGFSRIGSPDATPRRSNDDNSDSLKSHDKDRRFSNSSQTSVARTSLEFSDNPVVHRRATEPAPSAANIDAKRRSQPTGLGGSDWLDSGSSHKRRSEPTGVGVLDFDSDFKEERSEPTGARVTDWLDSGLEVPPQRFHRQSSAADLLSGSRKSSADMLAVGDTGKQSGRPSQSALKDDFDFLSSGVGDDPNKFRLGLLSPASSLLSTA